MSYRAPVADLLFAIRHFAQLESLSGQVPQFADADMDTAQAVLEECAKFNEEIVAPLNWTGDRSPATLSDGKVTTTPGFKAAFEQYVQGGWQALQHPTEFGGQGLPKSIAAACTEMLHAANMSFGLCPMLTDGAVEALLTAGSDEQKRLYIDKLLTGQWTGTMNLTEPQAGSDLSLVRTRAEPAENGSYKIFGTKIFITYGDHDYTENIVHLVLARVTGAPEGIKGISLFLVPKYLHDKQGNIGQRNDVYAVGLEHKLGIKASPTCTLQYGDNGGAVGYLIGEENRGLEYMFIMMNAARYGVGIQGVAVAERAYQKAVAYAKERVQSRPVDGSQKSAVPIIVHPDVRRMLMKMRAYAQAGRALAAYAAGHHDWAHFAQDEAKRSHSAAVYEYLVPLVKGFCTEVSQEVCSLGVQVHGGMGFIEETGAAQFYRDSKILTIYEGTTAIQANDLVGRKTARNAGQTARWIAEQIMVTVQTLRGHAHPLAQSQATRLEQACQAYLEVVDYVIAKLKDQPNAVFAGSVPYLMLAGNTICGWLMARAWLVAQDGPVNDAFLQAKKVTAEFYSEHILSHTLALRDAVIQGADSVLALSIEQF